MVRIQRMTEIHFVYSFYKTIGGETELYQGIFFLYNSSTLHKVHFMTICDYFCFSGLPIRSSDFNTELWKCHLTC